MIRRYQNRLIRGFGSRLNEEFKALKKSQREQFTNKNESKNLPHSKQKIDNIAPFTVTKDIHKESREAKQRLATAQKG